MRTYPHPARGWAGGLRLLASLALLVACARPGAAQQRKYLVELGAAGAYQSFDTRLGLDGAPGRSWPARRLAAAQLSPWRPRGSSRKPKTNVRRRVVSVEDLRRLRPSTISWWAPRTRRSSRRAAARPSTGATARATRSRGDRPAAAAARSSAAPASASAITPTVMIRADGMLQRNKSKEHTDDPAVTVMNFGANLGLSLMLGSKPIPDGDADGVLDNRDQLRRHAGRGQRRQPGLPERQRRRRRARRRGPLPHHGGGCRRG